MSKLKVKCGGIDVGKMFHQTNKMWRNYRFGIIITLFSKLANQKDPDTHQHYPGGLSLQSEPLSALLTELTS